MARMTSAVKSSWPNVTGLANHQDGTAARAPLDPQVGKLLTQRGPDGGRGPLLEIRAALLAGTVGVLGLGDDDTEVDVGHHGRRSR
jgi:hypothetical protein